MKNKIILEASNIYSGGGLVLLKLLLNELNKLNVKADIYLGYKHVVEEIQEEKYNNLNIIKTNTRDTMFRYLKKRKDVVFLCNLPPFVKNKDSFLVFYNELFFKKKNLLSKSGIKFTLFNLWFKLFNKNIDTVIVQSPHIEKLIREKTNCTHVKNIPIYKKFDKSINIKKEYDFCYISSAAPHKNHNKLFDALELLLNQGIKTNIILTIPSHQDHLLGRIEEINSKHQNAIINVGYIDNSEIEKVYLKSRALIFPSVAEAFGMPLIEAHDLGLKVLVSNLPYAFDVFEEVSTFDPENVESIANTMKRFLNGELEHTKQISKVVNQLDDYVNLLIDNKHGI
ncbi:glycosyltransferase [Lacinutrix salivirga]